MTCPNDIMHDPASILSDPMQRMYDLLEQLTESGITPDEAQDVLYAMVARVLAVHPATSGHCPTAESLG